MIPLRLYIQNFLCHETSYIDFSEFESALIVAKINNNDNLSNGAGKTSIFKAIEYALFGKLDIKLESIIRDDTDCCRIVLDFESKGSVYRISRKKTRKSSDFSFFQKVNNNNDFLHEKRGDGSTEPLDASKNKDQWKNLTCTRDGDTTKELNKIININYKSFRSTVHFVQNDFDSIAKSTPEKRKQKFKEMLDLVIYSKLEKLAKTKLSVLTKKYERQEAMLDVIGNPDNEIIELNKKLNLNNIERKKYDITNLVSEENKLRETKLSQESKILEMRNSVKSLVASKKSLINEIDRLQKSVSEYKLKAQSSSNDGKTLVSKIKSIKDRCSKLESIDYNKISILEKNNEKIKTNESLAAAGMQAQMLKQKDLNIPIPDDDSCKHCRQTMTKAHKEQCKENIAKELLNCQKAINSYKKEMESYKKKILENNSQICELNKAKLNLSKANVELEDYKRRLSSEKSMFKEFNSMHVSHKKSIISKKETLEQLELKIDESSLKNIRVLEIELNKTSKRLNEVLTEKNEISKKISNIQNIGAVIEHSISEQNKNKLKIKEIILEKKLLSDEMKHYPEAIKALGSNGIPNLIIQNLLDDLQMEANTLLNQLKPGLQLEFVVEKEKTSDDTLDIVYYVNGRKRYYEQISGAMKLCIMFSLKVGMSFLLQKMLNISLPLLLLDEVDQSLDKAGVDAFANIVKFFQKDFKIMVITHNDRLKGKFNNVIMVRQDGNEVSRAKVESGWL